MIPVPEERVLVREDEETLDVGGRPLRFIDTPGHARHHFCIWDEHSRGWFTGDTFGISYRDFDTANGEFIFPTTTPIQFDPPALKASMQRMMDQAPDCMYLTHFGRVTEVERLHADLIENVDRFVEIGLAHDGSADRTARITADVSECLTSRARAHGVSLPDEDLAGLLANDIDLNTQGIEVWLDHGR